MDEPQASGLSQVAVQPFWPLLAIMFGGAWLSWPWFVLNAHAIGSPTRRKEMILAACGFAGSLVIGLGIGALLIGEVLPRGAAPYLILVPVVWKIGVSYWLYALQSRTFGLYEYFGGSVQNGLIVILAGYFARRAVLGSVFDAAPLLALVLG